MKITSLILASCLLTAHGIDSKSKAGKTSPSKSKGQKSKSTVKAKAEVAYKMFTVVSLRAKIFARFGSPPANSHHAFFCPDRIPAFDAWMISAVSDRRTPSTSQR